MALPAEELRYSFADALTWDEGDRIELIDGEAYLMAPPLRVHQEITAVIFNRIFNFLGNCSVSNVIKLSAPRRTDGAEEQGGGKTKERLKTKGRKKVHDKKADLHLPKKQV